MVTRLDAQKGLDIAGHAIHLLLNAIAGDAQFAVLGSGAPEFETMFRHLAAYHSRKMAAVVRYDAALAPLMYAGSDLFLMPSRFEPCGLGQMIAMRYGSVPVVRQTGGLADTVHEGETGFSFVDYTSDALWQALARAVSTWWHDRSGFQQMQQRGMAADFSWADIGRRATINCSSGRFRGSEGGDERRAASGEVGRPASQAKPATAKTRPEK